MNIYSQAVAAKVLSRVLCSVDAQLLLLACIVGLGSVKVKAEGLVGVFEEVVVTARKREESLQDTPISITAFTSADIEARQLTHIGQITQSTPNLVFDAGGSLSGTSSSAFVFIRGVGQLDFTFNADPGVGTYVDGVYLSRSIGGLVNLLDIERVEVLRGPQGTLFGKNTTGGAISITSKRPTDEFEGKAGINLGSFERIEGYASVNLPITQNLSTRTAFSVRKRDGNATRLFDGADTGDIDAFSGRSVINWTPNDNLEVFISIDGTRERQGVIPIVPLDSINELAAFPQVYNGAVVGPPCVPAPSPQNNPNCFNDQFTQGTGPFTNNAGFESRSELDLWGISGTITWDIGELTLKSITAVRDFDLLTTPDLDLSPLPVFDDTLTQELTAISQEVQLLGNSFDNRLEWILGLYYLDEDANHREAVQAAIGFFTAGGDTKNESLAVFAQGTFDITDKLSLTAGIRYTDESREFTPDSRLAGPAFPGPGLFLPPGTSIPILPAQLFETSSSEVTPMVNLAYAWSDELNFYITYSEGFKSGGFSQRIAQPNPAPPSFDPEFVKVIEGGLKLTAFDNRLRVNASFFHTDFSDVQVLGLVPGVIGLATNNAGEADIDGFELEFSALPMQGLLLQGGVGYLDAEYTELDPSVVGITLDSRFPNAPKWTTNASVSYQHSLLSGHTLTTRMDWFYRTTASNTAIERAVLTQDGYSLLNASIAFETNDGNWSIVLSGKNLSDETYLIDGNLTEAFGTTYGTYALSRTWALNLERRF